MFRSAAIVLVAAMPLPALAQSGQDIENAIDMGIEALNAEGANLTIGRRSVEAGNVLLLEDIRLEPEDSDAVVTTDWLRIAPSADTPGSITVTLAPELLLVAPLDGEDDPMEFVFENSGLALTTNWILSAAGKPQGSVTADQFRLTAGAPDHPVLRGLNVLANDLAISVSFDEASRSGEGSFSFGGMIMDYDIVDPQGAPMVMSSASEALEISFSGSNLQEGELELQEFLDGGGSLRMEMRSGASNTSFSSTSEDFPVTIDASGGAGSFDLAVDGDGFDVGWEMGAIRYNVIPESDALPIPPFEVGLDGSIGRITSPLVPTENFEQMALKFSLENITVGEGLWSMIDPGQTIPRDPISIDIDLGAVIKLFIPLDEAEDGASPFEIGEVETVSVRALDASGGGAQVSANGEVDIDNSGPIPMPEGQIDVAIRGVQTLSQSLVALGLMEQMQAGMLMGGIMAFSKPGEEPDSFTSLIEFRDGQVLANGAPLPIQ